MSDLTITGHSYPDRVAEPTSQSGGSSVEFDLWGILSRHPWVLVACALVSAGIGTLYYFKMPPKFESSIEILFQNTQTPTFSAESLSEERLDRGKDIATHLYSVTSPVIVQKALASIPLPQSLADVDDPVKDVIESLTVEPIGEDSNVVSVRCVRPSETESRDILNAILTSYQGFLGELTRDVGQETASLIFQAKNEIETQLQTREEQYREFQKNAPIVWEDGKAVNLHYVRQLQVDEALSTLAMERAKTVSKLNGIRETLALPDGKLAVFMEAMKELAEVDRSMNYGGPPDQVIDREKARLLSEQLMQLTDIEAKLLEDFGRGHPEVDSVRKRIETLRTQLANTGSQLSGALVSGSPEKINHYVAAYVTMLSNTLTQIEKEMRELETVVQSEQDLAGQMQAYVAQDESMQQELERTRKLFDAVVARLDEINIVRDHNDERMHVMATPMLGEQVSPTILKAALLSFGLFGVAGAGLSYLLDLTEWSYRSSGQIRRSLNKPVIGIVPKWTDRMLPVKSGLESFSPTLVAAHQSESVFAESYRAIRNSILFSTNSGHKIVQVTSPIPSDGKSTVAANLAVSLAQAGKKVLVIGADFRRPSIGGLFGRSPIHDVGLADVIRGDADPTDGELSTEIDNLFVMTCGRSPDNPSELLCGREFATLLEAMRAKYDYVLLDTPPMLSVSDPSAVAARADAIVLALRIRRGCRLDAERCQELLNDVQGNLIGVVANAIDPKSSFRAYGARKRYGYYNYPTAKENDVAKAGELVTLD